MLRRRFLYGISFAVISLVGLSGLAGQAEGPEHGLEGPRQGVLPDISLPANASATAHLRALNEVPKPGLEVPEGDMESLKWTAALRSTPGGGEVHYDTGSVASLAPTQNIGFNGIGQNGWIPYDAAIAVGPNHVLVMTNAEWAVYSRTGGLLTLNTFASWWGTVAGTPFDPKCVYDPLSGRFVMLAVSKGSSTAYYHLSVSNTNDPTGAWFSYRLDATLDGSSATGNWADFPGLGYDEDTLYITSNQFTLSGNSFRYAKIRIIDKAAAYGGGLTTWTDFVGLLNSDSTKAFTVQPARALSATSGSNYLLNTRSGGGTSVTLWRIDNAPASPTLVRQATLAVGTYSVPPDAPQAGTSTLVATNDSRAYDVVLQNGIMHTAFGEAYSGLAAIRYLRIAVASNAVQKDITYTSAGLHYYFPAVTTDASSNVYFVFNRSSASEYVSVQQTGMTASEAVIEPSALVYAGLGSNTTGRWGDYSGIATDPANPNTAWIYGGYATGSNSWATRVASVSLSGATSPTLGGISPASGTTGTSVPVTLTGTNFVAGATVAVGGGDVTVSNTSVASSTQITATFAIAGTAAIGGRSVTVTTSGGTSGAVTFTVNPPPPTLSPLKPLKGNQGQNVLVAMTGTNFVPGGTSINFSNGTGLSATNINVTSPTAMSATFQIGAGAASGWHTVTVTTAGGTSNGRAFRVFGVPSITTISPASGNRATSVSVTLTGTDFSTDSTVQVSGTGVAVSNLSFDADWKWIKATFTIDAGAATGPRNVTVTNSVGTSNAVIFTVQ
jgi:hypothetical protein